METIECTGCEDGISCCKHKPGWFSPVDAEKAIKDGFAKKMMLDWWESDDKLPHTYVLSAPIISYEGKKAPDWANGICTLLTADLKCSIHNSGYKPLECAVACCKKSQTTLHLQVAKLWNTDDGRRVIELWKKEVSFEENDE